MNPGGGASYRSSEGSMFEQLVQGDVLDVMNNVDSNLDIRGAKVLGYKKQVALVSDKCVTKVSECGNAQKSIVSGVKTHQQNKVIVFYD